MDSVDLYWQALAKAGGAGSRGGNVIGKTRSGKPIYASSHEAYAGKGPLSSKSPYHHFTSNEHADAAREHAGLKSKAIDKVNRAKRDLSATSAGTAKHSNLTTALTAARNERDTHLAAERAHIDARASASRED